MAFPPVGVRLVAQDAPSFDSALKTAGAVLDGFGATASAAAKTASSALSGMANTAKAVLDPLGNLFDRIFNQVFRVLVRQAVREIENFIGGLASAAIAGSALEKNLSRVKIGLDDVSKTSFAPLTNELGDLVAKAAPAFLGIVQAAETYLGGMGQNALAWGSNVITQFAQGMWDAVGQVLSVLTELANMITYWLSPGSPPRLLPDIDKWGTAAANEFFGGWAKADFSVFSDLSSTLTALIRSIPIPKSGQMDVVPDILGAREGIAAAVEELRSSGAITQQTMDGIIASVGTADASVRSYLEAMVKLQAANADVKTAQDELNKVTKAYQELLKPIDDELAGITEEQQQLADEQKKSLLQLVLKDPNATLSEKRNALLEIEKLDADKRRRALLAEQKTAVDVAQTKLDTAKTAQQLAQDEYDARKAVIQVQTDQNSLLKEQLRLMEAAATAAAKGGGGKPQLTGFQPKPFNLGDLIPDDILGKWDTFVEAFGGMWDKIKEKFQPTIDAINNDLIPAFGNLLDAIEGKKQAIINEVAKTLAGIIDAISDATPAMVKNMADAIDALAEIWRTHGDTIIKAAGFTFRAVSIVAISAFGDILAGIALDFIALSTIFDVGSLLIQGKWTEAWERLKKGASDAWDVMIRTGETNLTLFFDLFGLKWDDIKTMLQGKWDEISGNLAKSLQAASDNINTTLNGWAKTIDTKLGEAKKFFETHTAGMTAAISGPLEALHNLIEAVKTLWEFLNTHVFHFPNGGGATDTSTSSNDTVSAPNTTGASGTTFNSSSSTGPTFVYSPTYGGSPPSEGQAFATMAAMWG